MTKNRAEECARNCLLKLAMFYSKRESQPPCHLSYQTSTIEWTKAEIAYYSATFNDFNFIAKKENEAGFRLPPDLTVWGKNNQLLIHLERETRGWEWNHIFGAAIKLFFVNPIPAPICILVLNMRNVCLKKDLLDERLKLLENTCSSLFSFADKVQSFYLALWMEGETRIYHFKKKRGPAPRKLVQFQ